MHVSTRLTANPLPKLVKNLLAFLCADPLDSLLKFAALANQENGTASRSLTLLLDGAQLQSTRATSSAPATPAAPQTPPPPAAAAAATSATSSAAKTQSAARDPASQAFLEALGFFGGLRVHPARLASALAAASLSRALFEQLLSLRAPASAGASAELDAVSGAPAALEQTRGIALAFALLLRALPDASLARHAHFADLWTQLALCIDTPAAGTPATIGSLTFLWPLFLQLHIPLTQYRMHTMDTFSRKSRCTSIAAPLVASQSSSPVPSASFTNPELCTHSYCTT